MSIKISFIYKHYKKNIVIFLSQLFFKIKPYLSFKSYKYHISNLKNWNDSVAYLSKAFPESEKKTDDIDGLILIDATWENACYWFRYSLLRKSLSFDKKDEVALIGKHNQKKIKKVLLHLGITRSLTIRVSRAVKKECKRKAKEILLGINNAEDIFKIKWPLDIPSEIIYDEILRKQRGAKVDVDHYDFFFNIYELLCLVHKVDEIFSKNKIGLLIVSHIAPFNQSTLIWKAIEEKVPVIFLYSAFSTLRMLNIRNTKDYVRFSNAPTHDEFRGFSDKQKKSLQQIGASYIKNRLDGRGDDIGSIFAFKKPVHLINRNSLCEKFNWPINRPIITVYASKWFDTPHAYGMTNFRDFLDWIEVTLDVAKNNKSVSWLLKAHPCDKWYGGLTLKDVIPSYINDHIKYAEDEWNGKSIVESVDGLVTVHGTSALEYASMSKPVLCADKGWYTDYNFVNLAASREEYIETLSKEWWKNVDLEDCKNKSEIFCGCFFGIPAEQENFLIPNDFIQDEFYEELKPLVENNYQAIKYEQKTIYEWFKSEETSYHSFKMKNTLYYKEIIKQLE